nr:uncharacterized protein LOC123771745 [Procambarus clarkii]
MYLRHLQSPVAVLVGKVVLVVLVVALVTTEKEAEASTEHIYKILYEGTQMISASYTFQGRLSKIMCSSTCHQRQVSCWVFTWDLITYDCHLLVNLTALITLAPAPASLLTYYVYTHNHLTYFRTPSSGTWQAGETACQAKGGHLGVPPDSTYAFVLHHLFQADILFMGIKRKGTSTTWLDLDGNPIKQFPAWYPGEPNDLNGNQNILVSWTGLSSDYWDYEIFYGVCSH